MSIERREDGPAHPATRSWWVPAVGALVALGGAAVALWGVWYLRGALAPDNRTNPLRDIGLAVGIGTSGLGAIACLSGLALVVRYRPTKPGPHSVTSGH